MDKKDLKPASVFHYFEEICQVPRPSKREEKIIAYLKAFGEKHGLETKTDEAGNIVPDRLERVTISYEYALDKVTYKTYVPTASSSESAGGADPSGSGSGSGGEGG